jgi:hypothetical protein
MPRVRLRRGVVGAAALLLLALPAPSHASPDQQSFIMDDDLLVYRGDQARDDAMKRMKALGADGVRVTVLWSVVADRARSTRARDRRFRRLGADDPRAYPRLNWDRYDRLVRACRTLGMVCYLDLTYPGPSWGHEKPPASQRRNRRTWKPKPGAFADFVAAVGKRYSGRFRDENDGRRALPRVDFWALGNEPNQGGWLTPQWSGGRPASPAIYRRLFQSGRRALQRTGHGNDTILIGETAPLGNDQRNSRSPIRPKTFIRQLFCVDAAGNALAGAAARAARCSDLRRYGRLRFTHYAHHPYTKTLGPTDRDPSPDALTMANIGELPALLDEIAAKTGRIPAGVPVMSTEFGYETNPPDRFSGQPPDKQALWLAQGDLLAYQQPRIAAQTQFLLRDVAPLRRHKPGTKAYWFTYQSGLYFQNDTAKPGAVAWGFPFLVTGQDGPNVSYWGQMKFRPNGVADTVQLQWSPDGATWVPIGDVPVTSSRGFFAGTIAVPGPGRLRATWPQDAAGTSLAQPVG